MLLFVVPARAAAGQGGVRGVAGVVSRRLELVLQALGTKAALFGTVL